MNAPYQLNSYMHDGPNWKWVAMLVLGVLAMTLLISFTCVSMGWCAEGVKASWYSVESLKKEGTFKYSKGVMANGQQFKDEAFTCATRLYRLGAKVKVTNRITGDYVYVTVTDRIGKRFAQTRIDLSKAAFAQIGDLRDGLVPVVVELIGG